MASIYCLITAPCHVAPVSEASLLFTPLSRRGKKILGQLSLDLDLLMILTEPLGQRIPFHFPPLGHVSEIRGPLPMNGRSA